MLMLTVFNMYSSSKIVTVCDYLIGPIQFISWGKTCIEKWSIAWRTLIETICTSGWLFWRAGIQQRHNSWQDGVLGTNCEIPSHWNWTYKFQVTDQTGSFFYCPSTRFQRAAGGYGGIRIDSAEVSPPFVEPGADVFVLIGDWYLSSHKVTTASFKPVADQIFV